jgi:hypothetical protein
MTDFTKLAVFKLSKHDHETSEQGLCAMEAVAWLEGLPHSDRPECTCPVIGAYVRSINDLMPDAERQKLIPYLSRLVGTVSKEHERERAEYLAWQALTVFAPAALRARGVEDWAVKLEGVKTLEEGRDVAREARNADPSASAAAAASTSAVYATYASAAVAAAIAASYADIWRLALKALDGVLSIGPSQNGFSRPIDDPVQKYREMVGA